MTKYVLKLYVTGQTPNSQRAIANLQRLCEEQFADQYELTIIDILEHPQLAEGERIMATPTLIRELPLPFRRLIGDFSQTDRVLMGLDLHEL